MPFGFADKLFDKALFDVIAVQLAAVPTRLSYLFRRTTVLNFVVADYDLFTIKTL